MERGVEAPSAAWGSSPAPEPLGTSLRSHLSASGSLKGEEYQSADGSLSVSAPCDGSVVVGQILPHSSFIPWNTTSQQSENEQGQEH